LKELIEWLANAVNSLHDLIIILTKQVGLKLTDKDLHFWVIGIIGIVFFFIVNIVFSWIAKWSVQVISFIYTFTVLIVIVFALEIEQKITNRGSMEFQDIVFGLWGFFLMFGIYLVILIPAYYIRKAILKRRADNTRT
jgi:hypothetical protein